MLGAISAATLGYIHGNTKGAYKAYKAYSAYENRKRKASKSVEFKLPKNNKTMQTPDATPGRGRSASRRRSSSRARNTVSISMSSRTRSSRSRSKVRRKSSGPIKDDHAVQKKGSTKVIKNAKRVKLDPKFRKKVNLALEKQMIRGTSDEVYYETHNYTATFNNLQYVANMGLVRYFSPLFVQDAASILWNNKPPLGAGQAAPKVLNASTDFDVRTLKVQVDNLYVKHHLKNNSTNKLNVFVYSCSPKNRVVLGSADADPLNAWADQLTAENGKNNVASTTTSVLYNKPEHLPQWRKQWNFKVTSLIMEPGESTTVFVQGPKDKIYDYHTFYDGPTLIENLKTTCYNFLIMYPELVANVATGATANTAARIASDTASVLDGHALLNEYSVHYTLRMPEQAGFTYPTAGTSIAAGQVQANNLRFTKYCKKVYPTSITGASIMNVQPQQPATAPPA